VPVLDLPAISAMSIERMSVTTASPAAADAAGPPVLLQAQALRVGQKGDGLAHQGLQLLAEGPARVPGIDPGAADALHLQDTAGFQPVQPPLDAGDAAAPEVGDLAPIALAALGDEQQNALAVGGTEEGFKHAIRL